MKRYNPLYYLLFILLVMGAFASMAQNSYGLKIVGWVAFAFSFLFLTQIFSVLRNKEKRRGSLISELVGLFTLSALLGFRVFYIYFPYAEILFVAGGVLLVLVYIRHMMVLVKEYQPKNKILAIILAVFHLSLILFIASLVTVPFMPKVSVLIGSTAFVLLVIVCIVSFLKKDLIVDGNRVTVFSVIRQFKNHSIVIASLFLLISFYFGFNKIGIVPGIYSDEFPQSYYKLVNEAAAGNEDPGNKHRHEDFKKMYDQFLKRNKTNDH